jgi:hypothetical protein
MHSAVTLAPFVGRLVARELVGDAVEPALAGCRLDRFEGFVFEGRHKREPSPDGGGHGVDR